MPPSDDEQNKKQKPEKKKGGFFTFLFNPEKFVEEYEEDQNGTADAATCTQPTNTLVEATEATPVGDEIKVEIEKASSGNGAGGSHSISGISGTNGTNGTAGANGSNELNGSNGHSPTVLVETFAPTNGKGLELPQPLQSPALNGEMDKSVEIEDAPDLESEDGFITYLNKFSYYDLLQLKADIEQSKIHRQYLRRMRTILKIDSEERSLETWQFQQLLQRINIAHQVLNDPETRKSYDQAVAHKQNFGTEKKVTSESGRVVDIIELIRIFKMLGPQTQTLVTQVLQDRQGASDHEIANKFVEDGLMTEEDLESVVLACYLLATGKINMTQLELVLTEIKETKSLLWVSLVAKGWIKMSDLS